MYVCFIYSLGSLFLTQASCFLCENVRALALNICIAKQRKVYKFSVDAEVEQLLNLGSTNSKKSMHIIIQGFPTQNVLTLS